MTRLDRHTIYYRTNQSSGSKAYLLLFSCSLTRAVHIQALQNQATNEFVWALKLFIARRGRAHKIYIDNAQTFAFVAKWVKRIEKNEKVNDYIAQQEILWQFKFSRAPWCCGQFKSLISLIKGAMYKTIGKNSLTWYELEEVLMDIEITLNNRPLSYVEDDIQMPILTPNTMIHRIAFLELKRTLAALKTRIWEKEHGIFRKAKI